MQLVENGYFVLLATVS